MLRRQYQNYLQRVSQRPSATQEYFPSQIPEELPSNDHKPLFDYDKKSSDIAMLKKAYGKTNEEKIEILDKYLQNLKSQKDQAQTGNKLGENTNDFNELKYFDEVSKKLNEGFNSNKANSIAEDIMNSIYSRHYKTDLFKDEPKKVSKFTSPNYTSRHSDKDKESGFGDSYNHYSADIKNNSSIDMLGNKSKNKDATSRNGAAYQFDEKKYPSSKSVGKDLRMFDEDKRRRTDFGKKSYDLSCKPGQFQENKAPLPAQFHENKELCSPSKTETDLNESEKQTLYNPTTAKVRFGDVQLKESEAEHIEGDMSKMYNQDKTRIAKNDEINSSTVSVEPQRYELEESFNKDRDTLNPTHRQFEEPGSYGTEPDDQLNNTNILPNNEIYDSEVAESNMNQNSSPIDNGKTEFYEKHEREDDDEETGEHYEDRYDTQETDVNQQYTHEDQDRTPEPVQYNQSGQPEQYEEYDNQIVGGESGQPLQYENNDQVYDEIVQPYEQTEQYDSSEQPIEQLYGDSGKAVHQYDENGQAIFLYDEQYNETSQPNEQTFEENKVETPQYVSDTREMHKENPQPIQQYDENDQPVQPYENKQSVQPIQQYDESVPPSQQYDGDVQPVQQYDDSGQLPYAGNSQSMQQYGENDNPIQQYDDNSQPTQQYSESGQPILHYDENSQPIQQYDENSQPIQQYDENSQPIQQYDANGQPLYAEMSQSVQQYDGNGQPIQQYDERAELIQEYDENAQFIQKYDENGQPVQQYDTQPSQQYDESGLPVQQYDENSQHIQQYEQCGQVIQQYDENGQLLQQYDENGQPIYFNQGEGLVQYDANGQIIQYDENGQPIAPTVYEESYQHYDANGTNQYGTAEQQQQNVQDDVTGENIAKDDIKPAQDENNVPPSKKNNVLDLLDTESESVKQNTSKISNDSDFDFTNG